ncbi:MAG: Xaa-Pro peptidase family protein [Candidatus Eisenbacteria bacterium]
MRDDLDRLMKDRALSGLVVFAYDRDSPAMRYVTGQAIHYGVYFRNAAGTALLIHDPMERDQAAAAGCEHGGFPMYGLPELLETEGTPARGFGRLIGEACAKLGIAGPIGFFGDLPAGFANVLFARAREIQPGLRADDSNPDLLSAARLTKDDAEVEAMRRASRGTVAAMEAVRGFLGELRADGDAFRLDGRQPATLGDVRRLIQRTFLDHGVAEDGASIVSMGRDAGVPHNHGNDADVLRAGTPILVDLFPADPTGYHSDMTRTFCIGRAPAPLREMYDDVRAAFDAAMESLAAGTPCRTHQERAWDVFEARGHATLRSSPGTEEGYVHGLGHGVGLAVHEPPRLGGPASNTALIEPRMVITVEPGLYYPARGLGARIEDLIHVRADGSLENLTPCSYELEVMPHP